MKDIVEVQTSVKCVNDVMFKHPINLLRRFSIDMAEGDTTIVKSAFTKQYIFAKIFTDETFSFTFYLNFHDEIQMGEDNTYSTITLKPF